MKQQNKWERLFETFMDVTEFGLIKHKNPEHIVEYETPDSNPDCAVEYYGIWSIHDKQGANLGNINEDRFDNAEQIFERMNVYIEDYYIRTINEDILEDGQYFDDYEECLGLLGEILADNSIEDDFRQTVEYHYDILDMIANHFDEIDLENVYYEEEE